jgi:hypothetical protein
MMAVLKYDSQFGRYRRLLYLVKVEIYLYNIVIKLLIRLCLIHWTISIVIFL